MSQQASKSIKTKNNEKNINMLGFILLRLHFNNDMILQNIYDTGQSISQNTDSKTKAKAQSQIVSMLRRIKT